MSSTIFFFLFIPLLAFILLAVNLIFAPHNPYMEKNSAFECGFSSFLGQNRTQFSISFFIFALLFLLFDLEILLVYPYLVSAYTNGVYGFAIMLMFLLALTLGFAYEIGKKALSIDSRQMSNAASINRSTNFNKVSSSLGIGKRHYSSLSNNVKFEQEFINLDFILYLWCRRVMLILSCSLLLALPLYLLIYIFGLTYFMPYINNILVFLLFLIHHCTNFYNYTKTRAYVFGKTNIKPYSNVECTIEFIISSGEFFSELINAAIYVISIICSRFIILLLSLVKDEIKNVIIGLFTGTPDYKALISTYHEKDFFSSLDTLSLYAHHFIIRNVLNIICYFLLSMWGVYMGFIPLSLFLLFNVGIFLSFSVVYICKYRSLFYNDVVFLVCLAVLLGSLGMVYYCIRLHILGAYSLLTKNKNNKGPSGRSVKQKGPEKGGGPRGPNSDPSLCPESESERKRRENKEYHRKYHQEHKEIIKARRHRNKDKIKVQHAEYYKKNRKELLEYSRNYKQEHEDATKEYNKQYNKEYSKGIRRKEKETVESRRELIRQIRELRQLEKENN